MDISTFSLKTFRTELQESWVLFSLIKLTQMNCARGTQHEITNVKREIMVKLRAYNENRLKQTHTQQHSARFLLTLHRVHRTCVSFPGTDNEPMLPEMAPRCRIHRILNRSVRMCVTRDAAGEC